jgi:hypothetical protein
MVIIGECEGKAIEWTPRLLADAMDTHGFRYHHVKKAVVMLRGLQDEHDRVQTDLDVALSYMKQYELEIAQLKVAYEQEQYRSKQWQERFESGRLT